MDADRKNRIREAFLVCDCFSSNGVKFQASQAFGGCYRLFNPAPPEAQRIRVHLCPSVAHIFFGIPDKLANHG
jgi:hypothetical protein